MILTQDELDEPILNIYGDEMNTADDKTITIRLLLIESILRPEAERSGDEKLKGYHMANKVNLPMGELSLEPDEVKFISDRVDMADWSDYLYGKIQEAFAPPAKPELREIPKES